MPAVTKANNGMIFQRVAASCRWCRSVTTCRMCNVMTMRAAHCAPDAFIIVFVLGHCPRPDAATVLLVLRSIYTLHSTHHSAKQVLLCAALRASSLWSAPYCPVSYSTVTECQSLYFLSQTLTFACKIIYTFIYYYVCVYSLIND